MKNQLVVQCSNTDAMRLFAIDALARHAETSTTIAPNSCRAMHKALSHAASRNVDRAQIEFLKNRFATVVMSNKGERHG